MKLLFERIRITLSLAARNIVRNKRRTGLTLLGVIFGVSTTIALAALARGLAKQLVDDSIFNLTGHIKIQSREYAKDPVAQHTFSLSSKQLHQLEAIPNIIAIIPRLQVTAVIRSERESRPVVLVGIDPAAEATHSLAGKKVSSGKTLSDLDDTGIVLGKRFREDLKTKDRRRAVIMTQSSKGELVDRGIRILGSYTSEVEATERQFAFISRKNLRALLDIPDDQYHEISLMVREGIDPDELRRTVQDIFPDTSVLTWSELQPLVDTMVNIQSGFLLIWFLIVIVSASFGLVNGLLMSIFERIRELAVMNALGMKRSWLLLETITQSTLLLSLGGLLGTAVGVGLTRLLADGIDISAFAQGASVAGIAHTIVPNHLWSDTLTIVGLLLLLGTAGSLYPAWLATQVDSARALQRE